SVSGLQFSVEQRFEWRQLDEDSLHRYIIRKLRTDVNPARSRIARVTLLLVLGPCPEAVHVSRLFDYLVGAKENCLRNRNAEVLGGSQVYRQLEPCRLLKGKVCRLCAFEDPGHVTG